MKYLKVIANSWNKFWFAPIDLLPAAFFRIVFSVVIFLMYSLRQFNVLQYYSDRSMVPLASAQELLPDIFRTPLFWFPASDVGIISFHLLFLFLIILIAFGFYSRICSLLALAIHVCFLYRNYAVAYGADIITCFWLFYLCFIESDRELSLKKKFKLQSLAPKFKDFSLSTVGVRLIQIQLCVIYTYTGFEKLKGPGWWEGTAVWQVMGNLQLSTMNLSVLQSFPLVIVFMTYTTMLFEIYFAAMVWSPKMRKWWLSLGVLFHLGIALTMGLVFFSGVMVAAYIVFMNADWLRSRLNLPQVQLR